MPYVRVFPLRSNDRFGINSADHFINPAVYRNFAAKTARLGCDRIPLSAKHSFSGCPISGRIA